MLAYPEGQNRHRTPKPRRSGIIFVAAVLATTKCYPNAVISGLTALQIHGLAQEYVDRWMSMSPRDEHPKQAP